MFNRNKKAVSLLVGLFCILSFNACSKKEVEHAGMEVVRLSYIYRIQGASSGKDGALANLFLPVNIQNQKLLSYEVSGSLEHPYKEQKGDSETVLNYEFKTLPTKAETVRVDAKVAVPQWLEATKPSAPSALKQTLSESLKGAGNSCRSLSEKLAEPSLVIPDNTRVYFSVGFSRQSREEKFLPSCWVMISSEGEGSVEILDQKSEQTHPSNYVAIRQFNITDATELDTPQNVFFTSRGLNISVTSN